MYLVDAQGYFNSMFLLWELPVLLPGAPLVFISANCLRDSGSMGPSAGAAECSDFYHWVHMGSDIQLEPITVEIYFLLFSSLSVHLLELSDATLVTQ